MPNDNLEKLDSFLAKYPCQKGILSTVIPLNNKVQQQIRALPFHINILDASTPIPIKNCYKTPQTLGTDRLAVAVAAAIQFPKKDVLIIDSGTCITFELVTALGEYLGGNISPGINMRLKALNHDTGQLPLEESKGNIPDLGYNTETAIRSGVINGIKYEIEGYIHSLRKKYPSLLILLTGGNHFNFDSQLKSDIFADKFLVLRGLNYILRYNDP